MHSYLLSGILGGLFVLAGCSEEGSHSPTPTPIDGTTITAVPGAGQVTLHWSIPADSNYRYVEVRYVRPDEEEASGSKECVRLASIWTDSLIVDNLLNRYGDLEFLFTTVNEDGEHSEIRSITARANPAERQVILNGRSENITLTAGQLYADNPETDEDEGDSYAGDVKWLIDGDNTTFYHASWSNNPQLPGYIVVDLGEGNEIYAFNFSYTTRISASYANNNPSQISVYGSNDFDGETYDVSALNLLTTISEGLPNSSGGSYTSGTIRGEESFRYLWFEVNATHGGSAFFCMSEFGLMRLNTEIYDPETGTTTEN